MKLWELVEIRLIAASFLAIFVLPVRTLFEAALPRFSETI